MIIGNRVEPRLTAEPPRATLAGHIGLTRQNEYLVRPGERAESIHLIIDGWAARYRLLADGRRQITALFLPGDFCDLAWLREQSVPHHVLALTALRSVRVRVGDVQRLALSQPGTVWPLFQEALSQSRHQTEWLIGIGRLTATERIARLMLEIAERCGMERSRLGSCAVPLTQLDMADATGLTAVHVNRTLQILRARELLEFNNKRLRIIDPDALAKLAVLPLVPVDRLLKAQCQRLVRVAPRS